MRKSAVLSIIIILIVSSIAIGCGNSSPASEPPTPVKRAEPLPVKYPQMDTNGLFLPEVADYPEISVDVAVQLFRECKTAAGFGPAIEFEVGATKNFGAVPFGQGYYNTIRVNDSEFLIIVRTKDAKVVSMTNLTATPDPVLPEISESRARYLAHWIFACVAAAEDNARQHSPQLVRRDQPDYQLSFVERNAPGMYSNAWYVQWDRISPIPYYRQMSYLRLRPDGLFLNAAASEGERCYETEAVIDEAQAFDTARASFDMEFRWLQAEPTSARLAYVIPNQYPPGLPSYENPVVALPEQNRLAWIVGVESIGDPHFDQYSAEVWVDALTGEVIGDADLYC